MTKLAKRWLIGTGMLSLAVCAAYYVINQSVDEYLEYMVWKALSSDAGEGAYAQVDETNIYFEIHGDGEPLLLLHGGFTSIDSFYRQIPLLAKHYRVIAVDSRGHGRSNDTTEPFNYADMSHKMSTLLAKLGIQKTRIVGWSDGGVIGLDLAMRNPELVGKLVTFGSHFHHKGLIPDQMSDLDNPEDSELLDLARISYQAISPHPEKWPEFIKKTLTMWRTQPTYTIEQLGKITAATLIMVGDDDMIKPSHSETLAEAIDNATLAVIPDSTHFAPIENPEAINRRILEFLAN
jgi:pimeloyl-ACP methyl ester carboxylesterase